MRNWKHASLAIAFALANPSVASVLFGATTEEQIAENAAAARVVERLGEEGARRLRAIGVTSGAPSRS